jgi:hypothetical protein
MLPEGAELKDLSLLLGLSTDKGEAKFSFECIAKSDAWKNYIKNSTDICGKISGDYLKYLPKGAFMMYANINGKKVFEMFDKNGVFSQAGIEDQKDMIKKILEVIDGDFAIGVGEFKGELPEVGAYLKTKDASIADMAKEQGLNPEKGLDFGFKDGATYVAVGENAAFTEVKDGFDKGVISGRRVYVYLDVALISNLAGKVNNDAASAAQMASDHIKTVEFYDTSDTAGELILKMKDADKDPVEYLIDLVAKQF